MVMIRDENSAALVPAGVAIALIRGSESAPADAQRTRRIRPRAWETVCAEASMGLFVARMEGLGDATAAGALATGTAARVLGPAATLGHPGARRR